MEQSLKGQNLVHVRYADNLLIAYLNKMSKIAILEVLKAGLPEGIKLHEGKTQYLEGKGTLFTLPGYANSSNKWRNNSCLL